MPYPNAAAERVLDELAISSIDDLRFLEEIAWARGALVRYKNLSGCEARLMAVGKPAIITISASIEDPRRQRYSIAHELGHLEMHRYKSSLNACKKEQINDLCLLKTNLGEINDLEHEANTFASELLLPKRFFNPRCINNDPSFDLISSLANEFNVSLTATALKYVCITDEPIVIIYSEGNRIRWFHGSKSFEEIRDDLCFFIDVRSQLDATTRAAYFFRNGGIPPGMKPVPASAWFTPGNYIATATIKEHSISMPNYDAVLTLLWIDEEIDEDLLQ
jgi:Zn-dependent peptidase ImmA (M78 family)